MSSVDLLALAAPVEGQLLGRLIFDDFSEVDGADGLDEVSCRRRGFSAKVGETMWHDSPAGEPVLLVGAGKRAGADAERLRRVGAACVRGARDADEVAIDARSVAIDGLDEQSIVQALGEGAILGSYRFEAEGLSPTRDELVRALIIGGDESATRSGIERAKVIGGTVCFARDLVNTPPSVLTPRRFAEIATEVASSSGLELEVFDEKGLEQEGFGGVLGVARGSDEPPRFIRATYEPDSTAATTLALVGKGVTFDSGGLSLKTAGGMVTMKTDMSGAAAVLATLVVCRALQVPVRVTGYMPLTENMPGGHATKPGDVLTIKNGKTIEVVDTDAEGRLILADALSYAEASHPDAIIDLATLTGACVQALGTAIGGLLGNDDRLIDAVRGASLRAGEPLWPLPLPSGYRGRLDSDVADMANIPGTQQGGGALTAALILEEFVGTTPWVHLDIAGPARAGEDRGYLRKGGTGFAVRTLIELLEQYEPLGGVAQGSAGKVVMG